MKLNQYVKKSLSRQFITLFSLFALLFLVGATSLFLGQKQLNETYYKQRKILVEKQELIQEINITFHDLILNHRSYIAFDNQEFKTKALSQGPELDKLHEKLVSITITEEDKAYANELRYITDYYFNERLPETISYMESGRKAELIQLRNFTGSEIAGSFQDYSQNYNKEIQAELNDIAIELEQKQVFIQEIFIFILVILLLILFLIIRVMFTRVGKPLAQFANAANEIAIGREAVITVETGRGDELGALSVAFRKMITSIQEKEQDLLAQNEELIAQQDELQAQQIELESMLETLRENERKLERRNTLTNGISNSLQKQEVLESIVTNMCGVLEADCGMVAMLNEDASASFGVSQAGIQQFIQNIESGLHKRLMQTKKVFTLKRELQAEDKGFHTMTSYCFDLYMPVISSTDEVEAVMVYSRFGAPFLDSQMNEYEALSKQIGISLEKIRLYESSEENRKLNQNIMDNVKEGIQLIDADGKLIQMNNQLSEMFQQKKGLGKLIGLPLEKWTSILKEYVENEAEFVHFLTIAKHIKHSANHEEYSLTYKMKNSPHVFNMYCEGLYHGKDRFGTVIVHRNITREFEVDQMKSEFVSTVSHELRTPLASILGFTELMLNRPLKPEKQTKYLTTIYNEAKRLTALINDFLDVQRMESGKQTYEKKFINLIPIIEKVIENQQIQTDIHQITLSHSLTSDLIIGDRSKMEHAFTNLLNNAVKYSPEGGDITISLYQEGSYLKVNVTDQGLGIPEDSLDKLFNKFYRVDNSDRRTIGGTGLGLAIVQEIMKAHEGKVLVQSAYGKGSTFSLLFPAVETAKLVQTGNPAPVQTAEFNVLVVEDDHSLAELIFNELSESEFHVTSFSTGKEALSYIHTATPDALVLDIMLEEDTDGWAIMKKMKESERLKNIPIIISSALDEKDKGFALGANDYLIKPYKPSELSVAIKQTLMKTGKVGQILVPEKTDTY